MKASLKSLAEGSSKSAVAASLTTEPPAAPALDHGQRRYRTAQTRAETRQVSGHFKPDVAQTLRLIAAEEGRDIQEILAEALNMVFARYGKAARAEVSSGRRKKVTT
jgi:antitoxin-like ribbon-helix-helix protein